MNIPAEVEIEAFRIGASSRGIGVREVDEAISSYSPDTDPAPLVIGHPESDKPAHGLLARARRAGEKLFVTLRNISAEAVEAVRSGRFINRSIAFWPPDHPSNPTPGRWNLRHLGLIGAAAPGIPGMAKLAFSDGGDAICCFEAPAEPLISGGGTLHGEIGEITAAANHLIGQAKARGQTVDFAAAVYAVAEGGDWLFPAEVEQARHAGREFAAMERAKAADEFDPAAERAAYSTAIGEAHRLRDEAQRRIEAAAAVGRPMTFDEAVFEAAGRVWQ